MFFLVFSFFLFHNIRTLINNTSQTWTSAGVERYASVLGDQCKENQQIQQIQIQQVQNEQIQQIPTEPPASSDLTELKIIDASSSPQADLLRWEMLRSGEVTTKPIALKLPAGLTSIPEVFDSAKDAIEHLIGHMKTLANWQFQRDDGKWESYPSHIAASFDEALHAERAQFEISHDGVTYLISMNEMSAARKDKPEELREIQHNVDEIPFERSGGLNELSLKLMERYKGHDIFKSRTPGGGIDRPGAPRSLSGGSAWRLERVGKQGGWESGGQLSGIYMSSRGQRAFIKRDKVVEPQIAEVLASWLMTHLFPEVAVDVNLVVPIAGVDYAGDGYVPQRWQDVYLASFFNMRHVDVLADHERVKEAYGGKFQPTRFCTPALRGAQQLAKAFPNAGANAGESQLFDLECLQKALIGNLLVANNDMHLGNMILYKNAESGKPLCVQAFDFGAAFNFDEGFSDLGNSNQRVAYDFTIRGAIKTEVCNHLVNYPEEWTIKSEEFWKLVMTLKDFQAFP